jgi:hypothetical protein
MREGRLGFVGHAREAFAFLARLGFVEISSTNTKVDWQGARTGLAVFHGPQSYIMGVEVHRLGERSAPVTLVEALEVINPDHVRLGRYQTSDPALVRAGLDQLASVVRDDCAPLLAGDPQVWQRVEEFVRQQNEAYTLEARFYAVRQRANRAWEAKDYVTALAQYREMKEVLTEAEKRRVEYLARVLGDPDG